MLLEEKMALCFLLVFPSSSYMLLKCFQSKHFFTSSLLTCYFYSFEVHFVAILASLWILSVHMHIFFNNAVGMTKQCFLNNITGRKRVPRINHINSSGIKWTKKCETHTTSIGLSTSHSLLQHQKPSSFTGDYYLREVGIKISLPSKEYNCSPDRCLHVLLNSLFEPNSYLVSGYGSINFMLHSIFSHEYYNLDSIYCYVRLP